MFDVAARRHYEKLQKIHEEQKALDYAFSNAKKQMEYAGRKRDYIREELIKSYDQDKMMRLNKNYKVSEEKEIDRLAID